MSIKVVVEVRLPAIKVLDFTTTNQLSPRRCSGNTATSNLTRTSTTCCTTCLGHYGLHYLPGFVEYDINQSIQR